MRSSITGGQRIRTCMSRTKHRVLDRDSGTERSQLHRPACLEILWLTKDPFVIWFQQAPRFTRKELGERGAFCRNVSLDRMSDGVETRDGGDASGLRNSESGIEERDAKRSL